MSIGEKLEIIAENVPKVYEAGKKAMWDALTGYGKRTAGQRAFNESDYTGFDEMPYPFVPTNTCQQMCYNYRGEKLPRPQYVDMSKVPTNSSDNLYRAFAYWSYAVTNEGYIPDYGIQAPINYRYTFDNSSGIREIEIIRSAESTKYEGTFQKCTRLINVAFDGIIGTDINFADCSSLSAEGIKNIAEHLKDFAGTDKEYSCTLTFDSGAFAIVEAEGATAEYNGVACTWAELIDNKKWNLTLA